MIREPSSWIQKWESEIPCCGTVLDLACGEGRHSLFLQEKGHTVLALDRSSPSEWDTQSLKSNSSKIEFQVFDLEENLGATKRFLKNQGPFSAIVVVNYLHRPLLSLLPTFLINDGLLLYETFMQGQERLGGPKSKDYLLLPGELRESFQDSLSVLAFEEGLGEGGFKQRYCGKKLSNPDR